MSDLLWIVVAQVGSLVGVVVGYLVSRARERRYWRQAAIRVFTQHPMSTQMPTIAEVGRFPSSHSADLA